jgi:hypothetical protein
MVYTWNIPGIQLEYTWDIRVLDVAGKIPVIPGIYACLLLRETLFARLNGILVTGFDVCANSEPLMFNTAR